MSKRVVIYPFFSQQDKSTGQFLLQSCGSTKMNLFLAEQMIATFGWSVDMVMPLVNEVATPPELTTRLGNYAIERQFRYRPMHIPSSNYYQRLHWAPEHWASLLNGADLLINHHEVLGWPIKRMFDWVKVVQMNVVKDVDPWPWMAPLFHETWKTVDLVVTLGVPMMDYIGKICAHQLEHPITISHWPLSYDETQLREYGPQEPPGIEKDIDVLFVLRASLTNYSHHHEFLDALRLLRKAGWHGKVGFTDITRYMAQQHLFDGLENIEVLPEPKTQEAYVKMLWRSRAVVALNDNLHGGMSVREAIYCGACPIVWQVPGYQMLLGDWPYYIEHLTFRQIAKTIMRASAWNYWSAVTPEQSSAVHEMVKRESFQSAWHETIEPDLRRLMEPAS